MLKILNHQSYLAQCETVSRDSHDPDRQVGSLIVSPNGRLLGIGTNRPIQAVGLTLSQSHQAISQNADWKYYMLEHAERNAINDAREHGHLIKNATMYTTLFPCADCARAIISADIKRLVVRQSAQDQLRDEKWRTHFYYSRQLFDLAGVQVEFVLPLGSEAHTEKKL